MCVIRIEIQSQSFENLKNNRAQNYLELCQIVK